MTTFVYYIRVKGLYWLDDVSEAFASPEIKPIVITPMTARVTSVFIKVKPAFLLTGFFTIFKIFMVFFRLSSDFVILVLYYISINELDCLSIH